MVHVHPEKFDALETYLVNYLSFKNTVFGEMDADEATSPPLPRTVPVFWVFEGHNQPGASLVPLEPCNQVPSHQVPPEGSRPGRGREERQQFHANTYGWDRQFQPRPVTQPVTQPRAQTLGG